MMNDTYYSRPNKTLKVFSLAMINIAAIISLRNLPFMAKVGFESIFFYLVAAFIFFIPSALVAAELATGFPSTGGIYTWVKESFGEKWGFLAIWLQWIENVIWYPTILSFAAGTFAYLFAPELASNKFYLLSMILIVYWGNTFLNFFGMKTSSFFSSIGAIAGTLIPACFIILLGCSWFLVGDYSHLHFSWSSLVPNMSHPQNVSFLVGVLLGFSGIEMSAVHAKDVENPQKNYPKAIFLSSLIIWIISVSGALSISIVVPSQQISLVTGVIQALETFFKVYQMPWATPILALLLIIGAMAMVSTWIVGPSKGLLESAKNGDIPNVFKKLNRYQMPVAIMLFQGLVVSLLSSIFLLMPNVSSSYWILTVLAAQLYLIMYLFMFSSGIRLRYKKPFKHREYCIPCGNLGMWVVAGVGFLGSLFAIVVGFFPPAQLETGSLLFYESFLMVGILLTLAMPLFVYSLKNNKKTGAYYEKNN